MNSSLKRKASYWPVLISIVLVGCQARDDSKNVSVDLDAFNRLVTIDIPFKSISWEAFGTPEYTGGVPGPTDHVTLIAQTEFSNDTHFDQRPGSGLIWIAPESARPWLEPEFRRLLENSKNETVDISKKGNCRLLTGLLKKTAKPVTGFACQGAAKTLIYLRIADYT